MRRDLPTLWQAKQWATELRACEAMEGHPLGHGAALEAIAHDHGFPDWNGLHAAIRDLPPQAWTQGGRVRGRYLSQPFAATVRSVTRQRPGWFRLSLLFDDAVDVVTFECFSNLRRAVHVVVGPERHSRERTSDGVPQVVLDMQT